MKSPSSWVLVIRQRGESSGYRLRWGPEARRSDRDDAGVAGEIAPVERQDVGNPVYLHEGDEPGVVHLNAPDRVGDDQPPLGLVWAAGVSGRT